MKREQTLEARRPLAGGVPPRRMGALGSLALLGAALGALLLGSAELGASALAQRSHRVRAGDSLSRIARRHRVHVWDLALANDLRPTSPIRPGQELQVPPDGVVYVRPGQTLSHVARDNETTVEALRRRNRLRPGRPLRVGHRLYMPDYEPPSRERTPRDWGEPDEPGVVTILRRGSRTRLRLVDADGRVLRSGLDEMRQLMRRHEDDVETRDIHPRLLAVLAAISDHFGGREVTLVSGLRRAGGFTRNSSQHVEGHASDIRVRGVPNRELWDYCRSLSGTGCGYYPRSSFVHVDVRERPRQWVDWSRPGRRPRYGTLRRPFRRRERGPRRPTIGRRVTRRDRVPAEVQLVDGVALLSSEQEQADAEAAAEEQALDQAVAEGEGPGEGDAEGADEEDEEDEEDDDEDDDGAGDDDGEELASADDADDEPPSGG